MKLTLGKFSLLLAMQFALIVVDLFLNSFGPWLARHHIKTAILFYATQDCLIIIGFLLFAAALQSTCAYQVGASYIILRNCKLFLCAITLYFLLSVAQHFWIVYEYRSMANAATVPFILYALSVMQRFASVFYYYSSKSTALTMADPRYKEEHLDWIAGQLSDN